MSLATRHPVALLGVEPSMIESLCSRLGRDLVNEHTDSDGLFDQLRAAAPVVGAVVVGAAVDPVWIAHRVRLLHQRTPLVLLSSAAALTRTERLVRRFASLRSAVWCMADTAGTERLGTLLEYLLEGQDPPEVRQHGGGSRREGSPGADSADESTPSRDRMVSELTLWGSIGLDSVKLMATACEMVVQATGVDYAKVLEVLPDGSRLILRAGVGWRAGLVGSATVETATRSQAGYTLMAHDPVVVEDLTTETRFSAPPLLREHAVRSGMSVVIPGRSRPAGVLGAHARAPRGFNSADTMFL